MKNQVRLYHPDDTFVYHIERAYCKVFYQNEGYNLLIEIDSTEDLDHVEADSIQNDFPQIFLSIEDFPLSFSNTAELIGKTIEIPNAVEEITDEEGDTSEVYYTNLSVTENDYQINNNQLSFFENEKKELCLRWIGEAEDFSEETNDSIRLEVDCVFREEDLEAKLGTED